MKIGTNAVVIAQRGECLRIGRGARIGAGAIVTQRRAGGRDGRQPAGARAARERAARRPRA